MAQNTPRIQEPGVFDVVPEADRAEQHVAAYPDDAAYADADHREYAGVDPVPEPDTVAEEVEKSWSANTADVIEQAIPVPLGDDYDGAYADDEP